jgi:hypothetical protein
LQGLQGAQVQRAVPPHALLHRIHQIIFGGFHGGLFRIAAGREQGGARLSLPYLACNTPHPSRDCAQETCNRHHLRLRYTVRAPLPGPRQTKLPKANFRMAEAPKSALSVPTGAETLRGIGIILVAYIVITGADAAIKWALPEVGAAMAMIWRGVVGGITVVILTRGRGLFPNNRRLLAWRGLLHCCVSVTWYWAWARGMPLVDSYAVACATPLLMTLFAIPLLGEKVGWRRWTSTMIGFGGVLIMLQPSGDLWRIETAALLGAVVLMAVTRIWTRMLSVSDGPAAIALVMSPE